MKTLTVVLTLLLLTAFAGAQSAQGNFTINVAPALTITTTSLPAGEVGIPYTAQVAVTGGVAPYSFQLLTAAPFGACGAGPFGALPAGLAMSASGAITGTPTASGSYPVCVKVTDSLGGVALKRWGAARAPAPPAAVRKRTFTAAAGHKLNTIHSFLQRSHIDEFSELSMVGLGAWALAKR